MGVLASFCQGLLDILYPPKCLVCGDLQPLYLCPACTAKIEPLVPPLCSRCGSPIDSEVCWECRGKRFHFDAAVSYGYYTGVLREAIHQLKYAGNRHIAPELGELMAAAWRERPDVPSVDMVVPVPIHRNRERDRGFNQSFLLAEVVGRRLSLPVNSRAIERIRSTKPQVHLAPEDRSLNVKEAFASKKDDMAGRNLILVDDVFTTGSTLDDAARALKAAGAASVHALTLARSV